jgi:hypothetical protein
MSKNRSASHRSVTWVAEDPHALRCAHLGERLGRRNASYRSSLLIAAHNPVHRTRRSDLMQTFRAHTARDHDANCLFCHQPIAVRCRPELVTAEVIPIHPGAREAVVHLDAAAGGPVFHAPELIRPLGPPLPAGGGLGEAAGLVLQPD